MNEEQILKMTELAIANLINYGPKLLLAVATLFIGLYAIKLFKRFFKAILEKNSFDPTLIPFLTGLVDGILKVMLFISTASTVGIETSSFLAALGAAGLAIGLALQGSLSNFAGGVLILVFKPFKVGDVITGAGHTGTVKSIGIIYTVLVTPQNQVITIPNGVLSNGSVINITFNDTRRLDMVFGIGYNSDIRTAKEILNQIALEDERVLKDPAHIIGVGALGDSSVDIFFRVWCKKEHFWDLHFKIHEEVKYRFDANNVSIPFPQRDVHLYQTNK
jgi:small conductance mechanosensitive channel